MSIYLHERVGEEYDDADGVDGHDDAHRAAAAALRLDDVAGPAKRRPHARHRARLENKRKNLLLASIFARRPTLERAETIYQTGTFTTDRKCVCFFFI